MATYYHHCEYCGRITQTGRGALICCYSQKRRQNKINKTLQRRLKIDKILNR